MCSLDLEIWAGAYMSAVADKVTAAVLCISRCLRNLAARLEMYKNNKTQQKRASGQAKLCLLFSKNKQPCYQADTG